MLLYEIGVKIYFGINLSNMFAGVMWNIFFLIIRSFTFIYEQNYLDGIVVY